MSSDNSQLSRILGMIRDLSSARTGVSLQDLRDKYGVTRRTVERDLATIEAAGYVIETLRSSEIGKIRKRIPTAAAALLAPVTVDELSAARAGVGALEREAPATLAATLRMLVNRLEESQTMAIAVDADALSDAQGFVSRPGPIAQASLTTLQALNGAILRCERVKVTYRKGGNEATQEYLAEPYGLLYGAKGYLVWRGVEDRKWRKFALPYLERVEPTGESFDRDPAFALTDFAADSFGVFREEPVEVVLQVLPEGMPRLRQHRFHSSQTIEAQPDGGAVVRFTASGLTEMSWHLFTWGPTIRIQAPEELVTTYAHHLEQAVTALAGSEKISPTTA